MQHDREQPNSLTETIADAPAPKDLTPTANAKGGAESSAQRRASCTNNLRQMPLASH